MVEYIRDQGQTIGEVELAARLLVLERARSRRFGPLANAIHTTGMQRWHSNLASSHAVNPHLFDRSHAK